ncbi:MAG: hypothetical protein AAB368_16320, partial [bacterium]
EERAQGLAYVLIVGAVLLVFVTALVSMLQKEMRWLVGSERRSVLLAATDAAVDRALFALQSGGNWDNIPKGVSPGYNQDVVYTDIPGIRYTIKIQEGNWTPGFQIGDAKLERTITVFASNSITGERRKIQALVMQTVLNSALYSGGQITISGKASIHWGPVVSYSTATDSIPLSDPVPNFPIFLSRGGITIGGARASDVGMDSPDPSAGVSVNEQADEEELAPPPVIPWDDWRDTAKGGGIHRYFGGALSATGCVNANESSAYSPAPLETSITFYDTRGAVNYDPAVHASPADYNDCKNLNPGAIGAVVKTAGNFCGRGILVVMGDLDATGNGCNLGVTMTPPPDCYPRYDRYNTDCAPSAPTDLTWDGTIYVAGILSYAGTPKIYGSLYAARTSTNTGNLTIYYKSSNRTLGLLGKSIFKRLWLERGPLPGDVFP